MADFYKCREVMRSIGQDFNQAKGGSVSCIEYHQKVMNIGDVYIIRSSSPILGGRYVYWLFVERCGYVGNFGEDDAIYDTDMDSALMRAIGVHAIIGGS